MKIVKKLTLYIGLFLVVLCNGCQACCETIQCADGLVVTVPIDLTGDTSIDLDGNDYIVVWSTEKAVGATSHIIDGDDYESDFLIPRDKYGLNTLDSEVEISVLHNGEVYMSQKKYDIFWEKEDCGTCGIGNDKYVQRADVTLND